jgi:hypothetical protein
MDISNPNPIQYDRIERRVVDLVRASRTSAMRCLEPLVRLLTFETWAERCRGVFTFTILSFATLGLTVSHVVEQCVF